MAKKGSVLKKITLLAVLMAIALGAFWAYQNLLKNNVHLNDKKFTYIYIKTNASFDDVLDELYSQNIIDDQESFEWMAKEMDLPENINSGKYRIDAKMSNRSIVKMIINVRDQDGEGDSSPKFFEVGLCIRAMRTNR